MVLPVFFFVKLRLARAGPLPRFPLAETALADPFPNLDGTASDKCAAVMPG
jgi:hypothetical protein